MNGSSKKLSLLLILICFITGFQSQALADPPKEADQSSEKLLPPLPKPFQQPFFTYRRKAAIEILTFLSEIASINTMDSHDPSAIKNVAGLSGLINLVRLGDDTVRLGPVAAVVDGLLAHKDLILKGPNAKKIAEYNQVNRRDLSSEKNSQLFQLTIFELSRVGFFIKMAQLIDQLFALKDDEEIDPLAQTTMQLAVLGILNWVCYTLDTQRKFERYRLEMPADLIITSADVDQNTISSSDELYTAGQSTTTFVDW